MVDRQPRAVQVWAHLPEFERHLAATKSHEYAKAVARYLSWWQRALGCHLERVTLADINAALSKVTTGRKWRVIALKAFTHWLRATGRLAPTADPTLALQVPSSKPGKAVGQRAYSKATVEATYRQLKTQQAKDTFHVLAATGMHLQELRRIAAGQGEVSPVKGQHNIAGVVRYQHKNGSTKTTAVDAATLAAVQRLVAAGRCLTRSALREATAPLLPGRLRHTFTTLALEHGQLVKPAGGGVAREAVAEALGHSVATNRKYYDGVQVPPMVRIPLRLVHP